MVKMADSSHDREEGSSAAEMEFSEPTATAAPATTGPAAASSTPDSVPDKAAGLFGEVVWAKSGSCPWWPSYVYDPATLPRNLKAAVQKARKIVEASNGKKHLVYFFW